MAPGTAIQKRKRGPDADASEAVENASDRDTVRKPAKKSRPDAQNGATTAGEKDDAPAEPKKRGRPRKSLESAAEPPTEASEPRKRGRPRKSLDSVPEAGDEPRTAQEPKKLGRPRKNLGSAPDAAPSVDAETSVPRKRGRPAKAQNVEDQAEIETEEGRTSKRAKPAEREGEEPPPNRRAKAGKPADGPSQKSTETTAGNGEPSNPAARRSQRDRRSADDNPWWSSKDGQAPQASRRLDEQTAAEQVGQRPQISTQEKSGKASAVMKSPGQKPSDSGASSKEKRAPKVAKQSPAQDSGSRRSTRDRRSADENTWWASQTGGPSPSNHGPDKAPSGPSRGAGRSRPSLAEVSASEVQNKSSEGRKSKQGERANGSGQEAAATTSTSKAANTKRIPGKGASRPYAGGPDEGRRASGANPPETQRRRRSDQANDSPADVPSALIPKYRHLTSRTRQIPRATITAKWSSLDDGAVAAIDGIISNCSLPVLSRFRDRQQRHQQAQTIMRTFAKRLHSKLLKGMPFPPPSSTARGTGGAAGHELELDFEKTVDAMQALEKTLDPLLHSVALLEAEREREEAALEKEYEELQALEANARAEARGWRERGKRDHVLAPGPRETRGGQAVLLSPPVKTVGAPPAGGVFSDLKEKDLVAISQQIGNHMESLRSNLQQIDGVLPAIVKSRAALQGVLHQHLDPAQYEQTVLG
ncbi:CENP-Q, a CENPA-CAD centromere complex subunit-domain-containing protein [Schizothecium vesticola]|uniref:CENP-Q, a CENPA-CAD centromere complex subunit-domain-containing protein n=1 Tax=Schizothecium vesticola TaxID=314040 RepID=A0AA40EJN0_9PEZI|nr:CENP-Q, a CENPA-CAD centromere complex subunit-domain-containing protein [Schizothecium vesticola]